MTSKVSLARMLLHSSGTAIPEMSQSMRFAF